MNNIYELPEEQMGLEIIAKIADRLSYTRTSDGRNCLVIVKHYQPISNQQVQTINLQVKTDITVVEQVLQWSAQLDALPIPQPVVMQCKIALVEGFTNAVRHAHKSLPVSTPIDLEIEVLNGHVKLKIWDCGQPFDLKAKLGKLQNMKDSEQRGILGIFFKVVTKILGQRGERKHTALDGDLM